MSSSFHYFELLGETKFTLKYIEYAQIMKHSRKFKTYKCLIKTILLLERII